MVLSNMYAQQAAKAADYRRMAEVQGDYRLASIYQGEYDRAIAQSIDSKFQEDEAIHGNFTMYDPIMNWSARTRQDKWESDHPIQTNIGMIVGVILAILVNMGIIALFC